MTVTVEPSTVHVCGVGLHVDACTKSDRIHDYRCRSRRFACIMPTRTPTTNTTPTSYRLFSIQIPSSTGLSNRAISTSIIYSPERPIWLPHLNVFYVAVSISQLCYHVSSVVPSSPSLADAGKHLKRHARRAQKRQADFDWLNPHSLGTISTFDSIAHFA